MKTPHFYTSLEGHVRAALKDPLNLAHRVPYILYFHHVAQLRTGPGVE